MTAARMCECVCVCVCMHTSVHMYMYMYVSISEYRYASIIFTQCTCMYVCMHIEHVAGACRLAVLLKNGAEKVPRQLGCTQEPHKRIFLQLLPCAFYITVVSTHRHHMHVYRTAG